MDKIFEILEQAFSFVDGFIDTMDKNLRDNIRRGFFTLVFFIVMAGIIMGYKAGQEAARIKSPPLAATTNEAFELDLVREGSGTDMDRILESEKRQLEDSIEETMLEFPSQETGMADTDETPMDRNAAQYKASGTPTMRGSDLLFGTEGSKESTPLTQEEKSDIPVDAGTVETEEETATTEKQDSSLYTPAQDSLPKPVTRDEDIIQ